MSIILFDGRKVNRSKQNYPEGQEKRLPRWKQPHSKHTAQLPLFDLLLSALLKVLVLLVLLVPVLSVLSTPVLSVPKAQWWLCLSV